MAAGDRVFERRLALDLGMTVRALRRMSQREFVEWKAYYVVRHQQQEKAAAEAAATHPVSF